MTLVNRTYTSRPCVWILMFLWQHCAQISSWYRHNLTFHRRTTAQNPAELLKLKDNAGYTCLHYLEPCRVRNRCFRQKKSANLVHIKDWKPGDPQSGYIEAVYKSMKYEPTNSTCTLEEFLRKVAELDCINVQATSGETPLLLCCRFTCEVRFYSVNTLIARGADPNITVSLHSL